MAPAAGRGTRPPAAVVAAAVAVLLLAASRGVAAQAAGPAGCTLPLFLNATASTISFQGSAVVAPIKQPLVAAHPEALVGLQGALALELPTSPCPTTAAAVGQALAGAKLQTTGATGLLQLFPTQNITLNGGTLVVLNLQGFTISLSTSPLAAAAGGPAGAFSADTQSSVVQGSVLTTSLISTETLDVSNMSNSSTTAVTAATQGSTLSLTLSVSWLFRSTYNTTLGTTTINGVSEYLMTGKIVGEVALGCPTDCGPNGRCEQAADGTLGCSCECGWSGASCQVPSGFCSSFPAELAGLPAVCPALPPAPAPSPSPPSGPCPAAQECNTRQQFNSTTGTCDCKAGWGGPSCDACQTGPACDAYFGASGATCSSEVAFQQGVQFKAFTCDLEGTGLEQTIVPGSFYMLCNTSASADSSALTSTADQFCEVNFALSNQASNPVTCRATECGFKSNSTRVDCATTECKCKTDCPDLDGILGNIQGQPCSIDCTPEGVCTFDIQDFFVTLVAPCQTASCVVPGFTFVEGDYKVPESKSYDTIIAALPLMVLAGLAGFLAFWLLRHKTLFSRPSIVASADGAAAAGQEGGAVVPGITTVRRRPAQPVQLLTFDAVSCIVPTPHGQSRLGRLWQQLFGGAGPAPQAAAGALEGLASDPPGRKQILRGVTGVAACGELVGVLGPSGSGKTTLLAILADSSEDLDRRSSLTGTVLLDGQPMSSAQRRKIAYVAQDDTLLPTLTVEECIRYSAILRLHHASPQELQAAVQSVLGELGLLGVAHSRVGGRSGIRGISGGERRRVTIGMELVTEPAVLVLDEPTSGLDSYTALHLMRIMKQVASGGRIVLLSFHQPSPAMFTLLDRAYLMAQGYCIFSGPPSAAEPWFAQRGLPCPVGTAIAEHMLDAVSSPTSLRHLLEQQQQGQQPATAANGLMPREVSASDGMGSVKLDNDISGWDAAAAKTQVQADGNGGVNGKPAGAAAKQGQRAQRPSLTRELAVVFWRTLIDILRNPSLLLLHWVLALLMGVFVGAVFFQVSFDVSGAQNRVGAMFFVLCFFAFTSLTTVDLLMLERRMVMREVRGGYYRPGTYLLAKAVLDALLLRVIPAFIFAAPFYPMMGLETASSVVSTFLMVLATFAGAMGAMSLAVTVGSSTAGTASLLMNIVLLLSVVVSGMLVNPESMPDWIGWTHYLSIFFYAYSALMINEMSTIKIDFELEGYAAASNVRGTVFLKTIGINANDLTRDIIILDCFYLALALLAFLVLYLVMQRRRQRTACFAVLDVCLQLYDYSQL